MPKSERVKPTHYQPTASDFEAMSWCLRKNWKIYPIPKGNKFEVEVVLGSQKPKNSGKLYTHKEVYQKIFELYKFLKEKNE
ncbi:MAG: hypothetical protein ABFS35_21545 [Bacteroidota bacterium]